MDVLLRGNGYAIQRGGLVAPLAKSGHNLFVDPVTNRLHQFRLDDISQRIDRDFDNHIALQVARKFRAHHLRIGKYNR